MLADYISKKRSFAICTGIYLLALGAALGTGFAINPLHPVLIAFIADVTATLVVYIASCIFHNASLYDAYWSIAPPIITLYWFWGMPVSVNGVLVLALVFIWGMRLTLNWASGWQGLGHEDWRYGQLRRQCGSRFWLVNLFGIQLMPTLAVFVGCLAIYPALTSDIPVNIPFVIALLVTAGSILLETVADITLRVERRANAENVVNRGLWAFSRHPNYLGEIGFWWGLYLCSMVADSAYWWTFIGPMLITALFLVVSIPLMEKRNMERRKGWNEYRRNVPLLLPRLLRNRKCDQQPI